MKEQIERGIELLQLCSDLQSEKDGVKRPGLFEIDKSKNLDVLSKDLSQAATNMSALHNLMSMKDYLAKLGKKLQADGLITLGWGDDHAFSALRYSLEKHGITKA